MNDIPTQGNADHAADPAGGPPPPQQVNSGPAIDPKPDSQPRKSSRYCKLRKAPIWIEAACAVALVGITGFYTHYAHQQADTAQNTLNEIKNSGAKTGKQTDDLITAAGLQARAATNNAAAATSFAQSAIAINNQIQLAVDKFDRMAKASERAAKATEQNLAQAAETLNQARLEQRAWVGITDVKSSTLTVGESENFAVWVSNTGKTPAIDLHIATMMGPVHPPDTLSDLDFKIVDQMSNDAFHAIIMPGQVTTVSLSTHPMTDARVLDIESGSEVLYIWGTVTYTDVFKKQHRTEFCLFGSPVLPADKKIVFQWEAYSKHNSAD